MSFDRMPGTGLGAEPAPNPGRETGGPTTSMRLQILATEHWSLLASRSLAWNESFSRSGMFLSTLAGSIVALALVAQASSFGEGFSLFALVILPAVLFIGVATYLRLGESNYHEALCVVGMNRIRAAYLEIAPDLRRYFVMSGHDDPRGISITMAIPPGGNGPLHFLASTPVVVVVLNSLVAAVIVALIALRMGAVAPAILGVGVVAFVLAVGAQTWYARASIARAQEGYQPLFPGPA